MAGLLSGACSAAAAAASVWGNLCLATCSLLVYGRMPRRFYTVAGASERLCAVLRHLLSYAAVLLVAVLVGAACSARAVLRRAVRGSAAPRSDRLLRGLSASGWLEHHSVKIRVSAGRLTRGVSVSVRTRGFSVSVSVSVSFRTRASVSVSV